MWLSVYLALYMCISGKGSSCALLVKGHRGKGSSCAFLVHISGKG